MSSPAEARHLIEEMNRYYEARAPWHDQYMSFQSNETMEKQLRPIIETLEGLISRRQVLEIACGTGIWTQVLARRARHVTAVDISATALGMAQARLSGYGNVTLKSADAYSLDGVDGYFDMLFATDWWSHVPKTMISSFLEAAGGKLAPCSAAVFIDMSMNEYFASEPCWYDEEGNRVSRRRLPDGSAYRVVKNFPTEDELRDVLSRYGRDVVYREFDSLKRWMVAFEFAAH